MEIWSLVYTTYVHVDGRKKKRKNPVVIIPICDMRTKGEVLLKLSPIDPLDFRDLC